MKTTQQNTVPALRFSGFSGEWKETKFKKVINLQRGSSPRPIIKYITNSDNGVSWIKIGDISKNESIVTKTKQKITQEGSLKSRFVKVGEIILSNSMSYGRPYILGIDGCIHDGWFVLKGYEKNFNKEYLYQVLASELIQRQYKRLAAGGVVNNISSEIVNSIIFKIPSLSEQKKIASFISSLDKKLDALKKKKEKAVSYKKGVMQKVFSQEFRFRDEDGGEFGEWDYKYGNSVFNSISNKKHNSDLPILAISQEFGAIPRHLINYKISVTENSVSSYKVVEVGDFIISLRSFQGGIEFSNYKGICSPAYIILRPSIEINNKFFKYYLKTHKYIQELTKKLEGIRDGKMISYKYFSEIRLPFPSIPEQEKIASFLSSLDNKIESLENEIKKIENWKKGLLQKMFV